MFRLSLFVWRGRIQNMARGLNVYWFLTVFIRPGATLGSWPNVKTRFLTTWLREKFITVASKIHSQVSQGLICLGGNLSFCEPSHHFLNPLCIGPASFRSFSFWDSLSLSLSLSWPCPLETSEGCTPLSKGSIIFDREKENYYLVAVRPGRGIRSTEAKPCH